MSMVSSYSFRVVPSRNDQYYIMEKHKIDKILKLEEPLDFSIHGNEVTEVATKLDRAMKYKIYVDTNNNDILAKLELQGSYDRRIAFNFTTNTSAILENFGEGYMKISIQVDNEELTKKCSLILREISDTETNVNLGFPGTFVALILFLAIIAIVFGVGVIAKKCGDAVRYQNQFKIPAASNDENNEGYENTACGNKYSFCSLKSISRFMPMISTTITSIFIVITAAGTKIWTDSYDSDLDKCYFNHKCHETFVGSTLPKNKFISSLIYIAAGIGWIISYVYLKSHQKSMK